jgi:hypothetical protein
MVRARSGRSTLGCLFTLLILMAIGYFSEKIARPFWEDYQFKDRMRQEARFAAKRSDLTIQRRLRQYADSLGLPEAAQKVSVRRRQGTIEIWTEYYVVVELPGTVRHFRFAPQVVGTY